MRFRRYARIYLKLQLLQLRTVIEYRADFWIGIAGAALMHGAGLVFVTALFSQINTIAGWTAWEIAILYGLTLIPAGLRELLCDGPWLLRAMLNKGEFDRVLVRPISPALQVATQLASIHGIGQLTLGIVAFWMGANRSGLEWSIGKAVFLVISVTASTGMLCAIGYLANMIGFWEPSSQSAIPTAYASLIDFAKFPIDIYNNLVRVLITIVAPFAFVSYFPALILLDKESDQRWLGMASPMAAVIVIAVTAGIWSKALNRYQGVGH